MQIACPARLDPELQWIATESAAALMAKCKREGRPASVDMMAKTVAADVVAAIGERLPSSCGEEHRLSVEEAGRIGSDVLIMVDPGQKLGLTARAELVGRYVLTAATVRAVSPVYRSSSPQYEYWPFGQDGGFCNPIKLKMLDD